MKHRLFVYDHKVAKILELQGGESYLYPPGHSKMVEVQGTSATVRAGLVPDVNGPAVVGKLYETDLKTLRITDEWLDPVYRRRKARVQSPGGKVTRAWVYYLADAKKWGERPGVGGDWAKHQNRRLGPYLKVLQDLKEEAAKPKPAEAKSKLVTVESPEYQAFLRKIHALAPGQSWTGMTPSGFYGTYARVGKDLYLTKLVDETGTNRIQGQPRKLMAMSTHDEAPTKTCLWCDESIVEWKVGETHVGWVSRESVSPKCAMSQNEEKTHDPSE